MTRYILQICFLLCFTGGFAQPRHFTENGKWGMKEKHRVVVPAVYDTVYAYDSTGRICMACNRVQNSNDNQFIKMKIFSYRCNYLDRKGKRLTLSIPGNDTCSVFTLSKNSLKQYQHSQDWMVASVRNRKYLADKNFSQLMSGGYFEITPTAANELFVTQQLNEFERAFTGLINLKEKIIIPYRYTEIKVNPIDSVIVACSAGTRNNSTDDIYNFHGQKLHSFQRHVDMATKNYVIHKIYEPKEKFVVRNLSNAQETDLEAEEVIPAGADKIHCRINNEWYEYHLAAPQKKLKKL